MQAQEIQFEEEISRNPYSPKLWWSYLAFKQDASPSDRNLIYERALKHLPRSYKLWHAYLLERTQRVENKLPTSRKVQILINTYERSLVHMHKMPRIWLNYCELLMSLHRGTETRKAFDRALQALPITQHKEVWERYIDWATEYGVPETAVRIYKRYLMYDQGFREDFVNYLLDIGQYEEAARQLSICLDDVHFISPSGQTEHQLWIKLCNICSKHPESVVNSLNVEAIIRAGIAKFTDEVGKLWNSLADYYIRLGQFEKARDIFEEAINTVITVRDFTIIFDSYIKIEESILTTKIRFLQENSNEENETKIEETEEMNDINMRLARIEYLMEKRPLLLNSVILRQNPNNVHEWHKRAKLYKNNKKEMVLTYIEAVKTIDIQRCIGKISSLWLGLAKFYENEKDYNNARMIYNKAILVNYKNIDELANIYCAYTEMEMRLDEYDKALNIMQQAVTEPVLTNNKRRAEAIIQGKTQDRHVTNNNTNNNENTDIKVSDKLYKNTKIWSLYLDLEESIGSIETCRAAYERVLDLKVITAQMCINYASFLEENQYFEDSFRVYEHAISLFHFPQVKKIWLLYLDKFLERYGSTKMERLRDLYEQVLMKIPAEDAVEFYIKYAKVEELYGLSRHAIAIYDRATHVVLPSMKLNMYRLYIKKVEQFYGITKTRAIYERGLNELNDESAKELCLEFATMERKLGEIDRARAVYQYGAQFADPKRESGYWECWRNFEEMHGNENTFREMLRVQRTVEASFAHVSSSGCCCCCFTSSKYLCLFFLIVIIMYIICITMILIIILCCWCSGELYGSGHAAC